MLRGVDILANAVKVTLGPKGAMSLEKSFGAPRSTKDGVTVAKEIELEDKFENMGAQMVREAPRKQTDIAGDGTTTACVLTQAIVREGLRRRGRHEPDGFESGHRKAVIQVVEDSQEEGQEGQEHPGSRAGRHHLGNGEKPSASDAEAMQKVGMRGEHGREAKSLESETRRRGRHAVRPRLSLALLITNAEKMIAELEEP